MGSVGADIVEFSSGWDMGVVVFSSRVSEAKKFAVYVLCAKPCKGTEEMDDVVFSSEMSKAKMLLQILFALSLVRAQQT